MKDLLSDSSFSFIKNVLSRISFYKLILTFLFLSVGQVLYVILPGLIGFLIDNVVVKSVLSSYWLLLFPLTWLISITFSSLGKFYTSIITQDARKESKGIIFHHIVHLPNRFFISQDAGTLENLMQELSFGSRYILNENIPFFIRTAITIIVATLVVFHNSIIISILFLFWGFLYTPISYFFAKKSVKNVAESIVNASKVSASTVEAILNHELIPAFGTENYEIDRFNHVLNNEKSSFNKAQKRIDISEFFLRTIQVFLPFSLVLFLLLTKKHLEMTPGGLATLFTMTLILTSQIGDFGKGILSFFEMRERMKTALSQLASHHSLLPKKKAMSVSEIKNWDIHFNNVSFSYEPSHSGMQNINLEIKENEKIGLVGFSGAGKTTLLKLLRGFLEPDKGDVFLGGYSLNAIDAKCLTRCIAEVSQSVPMFHRTIRENVAYGCDDISDDVVWDVLNRAQIGSYIKKLPEGLNTIWE